METAKKRDNFCALKQDGQQEQKDLPQTIPCKKARNAAGDIFLGEAGLIISMIRQPLMRVGQRAMASIISPTYIVCMSWSEYHLGMIPESVKVSSVIGTAAIFLHSRTKLASSG